MLSHITNPKTKMTELELEDYQKLNKFEKEIVDALMALGFTHKYLNTWTLIGWGDVRVCQFSRWSDVLKHVHEQGKDQKRFEFQRVLGI